MKPAEYWQKRAEINARAEHGKADYYISELTKEYRKSVNSIVREIEAFYGRYAKNNEVSLSEAKKQLEKGELAEFKMTIQEFTAKAKINADGRWTQQLNNVYYRTRISRYDALLTQIKQRVESLAAEQQTGFEDLLTGNYTDTYYRTLFDIQSGTGLGVTFAKVDDRVIDKVLFTDWAGSNFSKRIWENRDKLARELQTNLTQAFIRGDSLDKVISSLQNRFDVSKSNAARLVRTESAHIAAEATYDGYKASGVVKQYQFLATLDMRTSAICQSMDNKIIDLSDKEIGTNWPPLHANCRSTTVAYFDDEEDPGERIARDSDGHVYYVPGDMTYEQWKQKYVPEQPDKEAKPTAVTLKAYEDEIRSKAVEYSAVFDQQGRKLWESEEGTQTDVSIEEAVDSGLIKGNVLTHNHPIDASFSRGDIKILAQEEAAELRAVTPKYDFSAKLTDVFSRLDDPSKLKRFNAEIDSLFTEQIIKYREKIAAEEMTVDEATFALQHEMWKEFEKRTGWIEYRRVKRKGSAE